MAGVPTLDDIDVKGRRVLVRADLNVPMQNGEITDMTRIEGAARTIKELVEKGARVVVMSHFGRPRGQRTGELSLRPLASALGQALDNMKVAFADDCVGPQARAAALALDDGEVLLLENLRFHEGEEANDPAFVAALAELGEVYVNDAFSAAHRAHASTEGLARRLPAAAGRLMQAEIAALDSVLEHPRRPVAAIVGGAKVSTKISLLTHLLDKVQVMVIGGAMANTFLAAQGRAVGRSLIESDRAEIARDIVRRATAKGVTLLLPVDGVVAKELKPGADARVVPLEAAVAEDDMILDIGPRTVEDVRKAVHDCRTLLWNGPLGAFEIPPFDNGTTAVARAVAEQTRRGDLVSVAGGGDTVAALARAGVENDFTYVSMAGGAFLEWIEGRELPGVAALLKAKAAP